MVLATVVLTATSCSKDEPTPAEARHDRLEHRLSSTFSDDQVTCILGQLDPSTILALDRTTTLAPGSALDQYSDATRACVADPTSTTVRAEPDTTGPDRTSPDTTGTGPTGATSAPG